MAVKTSHVIYEMGVLEMCVLSAHCFPDLLVRLKKNFALKKKIVTKVN